MTAELQPYAPESWDVGPWHVTALSDGFFRLDGGSMWGVVPANLWRAMTPPEEDNTILLAARPFLLRRDDRVVVVEPGYGDRWEEKWRGIYHMIRSATLADSLAANGVAPEEVTDVVATHCHWDHIGAAVVTDPDAPGGLRPLFPAAVHHFPAVEVEMAKHPDHARRGSYRADDLLSIEAAGLLRPYDATFADGETGALLLPGLRAHTLGGHSDGSSVLVLNGPHDAEGAAAGDAPAAVFWGDVVPTSHHRQPAFIMAYDIDVVRSFEQRSRWLARACDAGWLSLFYHDDLHAAGRIVRDGKRYGFEPIQGAGAGA